MIVTLLLILALLVPPAAAEPPLYLDVSASRSEVSTGDAIAIDVMLFNDSPAAASGAITIEGPPGFLALTPVAITGTIPPSRTLELHARYRVASPPLGVARFLIRGGGQARVVAVGVCCVEAAPARHSLYLAMAKK